MLLLSYSCVSMLACPFVLSCSHVRMLSCYYIRMLSFLMFIVQAIVLAPILSFIILYSEGCNKLNIWIQRLIRDFEYNQSNHWGTFKECSYLLKHGLKKTNATFSSLLFCISLLYLTGMIFCAYLALFLSSKLLQGDRSNDILIQTGTLLSI